MFKLCLFRGCRIIFMLAVLFFLTVAVLFLSPPDVGYLGVYVKSKIQTSMEAEMVNISDVQLTWDSGPSLDIGLVDIVSPKTEVHGSHITASYRILDIFLAKFSPSIIISGGSLKLNLDSKGEESKPIDMTIRLEDVRLTWVLNHEEKTFEHVDAAVFPGAEQVYIETPGIHFLMELRDDGLPELLELKINSFEGFPEAWKSYVSGSDILELYAYNSSANTWAWRFSGQGEAARINVEEVHFQLPFHSLEAEGSFVVDKKGDLISLLLLDVEDVSWRDGENRGDFKLKWAEDVLHVDVVKGSVAMPILWSWLWKLGGDSWHSWLNSMHQGRMRDVQASLDLNWKKPLYQAPTHQNIIDMKYNVVAKATGVDIALGLSDDYLYEMAGDVLVNENHLEADIKRVVLKKGMAQGRGNFRIDWESLLMTIKAQGTGEVGELHQWLDSASAGELQWASAQADVNLTMEWNAGASEPNKTKVIFNPTKEWSLMPYGIELKVKKGLVTWDYEKGLNLSQMQVLFPWFNSEVSLFIDKSKGWALQSLEMEGDGQLKVLTDAFSLPIVKPEGDTHLQVNYTNNAWSGYLDLSHNTWVSFAGYEKKKVKPFQISFSGKPVKKGLLPIVFDHIVSKEEGLSFNASLVIDKDKLDFKFVDISTPALRGNMRLFMPLDKKNAWGLELDADYVDKPALTRYLEEKKTKESSRPWTVIATSKWVEWEKTHAENAYLRFSSDTNSVGEASAQRLLSGDLDLNQVKATFSIAGQGKYDLRSFEANIEEQALSASGSVKVLDDGSLKWQGLAFLEGAFGTLMKQAELDKLFKEGKMFALFLGKGEFKAGEPWWRKMEGNLRMRVDDGRMMEGGTLTRLLAAVSLVDLPMYFAFQRSDIVGDGLLYEKMQLEANFNGHELSIQNLALLSSALDAGGRGKVDLDTGLIDLVIVVRPWQNIEAMIASVPGLGLILTGESKSLKRKVYKIHGPASDALVDEVEPEDVGLPKAGYLEDLFSPSKWFKPKEDSKGLVEDK